MNANQKDLCIRILKIVGLVAVIALWLYLAVQFWNTAKLPKLTTSKTYLDQLEKLYPRPMGAKGLPIYIHLAGFPFLAFFLTVLVPDLFPMGAKGKRIYHIVLIPILCFSFLCAWVSCADSSWSALTKSIARINRGALYQILVLINLYLTPVSLVLSFAVWVIPKMILGLKAKSITGRSAGHTALLYLNVIVIGVVATALSASMMAILKIYARDAYRYVESFCTKNATNATLCFVSIILAPIIEEIVFRGLIQHHLEKLMPFWLALLLSAICFGVWHRNLGQFVYTFVMALIWGVIYHATGSIRHTMLIHFCMNFSAILGFSGTAKALFPNPPFFPALTKWLLSLKMPLAAFVFLLILALIVVLEITAVRLAKARETFIFGHGKNPDMRENRS